jgi:hypothetical protein
MKFLEIRSFNVDRAVNEVTNKVKTTLLLIGLAVLQSCGLAVAQSCGHAHLIAYITLAGAGK